MSLRPLLDDRRRRRAVPLAGAAPPARARRRPSTSPRRSSPTCWRRWRRPRRGSAGRPVLVVAADDIGARDLARELRAYLAPRRVRYYPSRGTGYASHLAPPPHLVGLRIAALDALAGSEPAVVVASAVALAEAVPDASLRPAGFTLERGAGGGPRRGRPSAWSRPATSASTRWRSAGSSRFAAASWTSSRPPRSGRRGWSCSATRSSRSAGSRPSPSVRWATPTRIELSPGRRARLGAPGAGRARPGGRRRAAGPRRAAAAGELPRAARPDPRRGGGDRHRRRGDRDGAPRPLGGRDGGDARRRRAPALRRRRRAARRARRDLRISGPARRAGRGRLSFRLRPPSSAARSLAEAERGWSRSSRSGYRVVVAFEHRGEAERARYNLKRLDARFLDDASLRPARADAAEQRAVVLFAEARLSDGFVSPELKLAVIPFRRLVHRRRAAAPAPARGRLATFTDLRVGDHVVHEDHGIARFAGFETKTVAGVTRDYLELELPRRRPRLRAHRPAREDHPLRRHGRRAAAALGAGVEALGGGQGPGPARRPRAGRASCSTSTRSAAPAAATRSRPTASGS